MKTIRNAFNLVELTLAIAVVGIGIAGVMAIFVPAINASKASVADNYLPDLANTFFSLIQKVIRQNPGAITTDAFSSTLPQNTDSWTDLTSNGFPNIYQVTAGSLYGVKLGRDGVDFTGHIQVRQEDARDFRKYGNTYTANPPPATPGLSLRRYYIEISWPVAVPYENREKRLYVTELLINDSDPAR